MQCLKDYYTMINVTNIVLLTLKETLMANLIKVNKERTSTTFFFVNFFSINCINLFSFFILSSFCLNYDKQQFIIVIYLSLIIYESTITIIILPHNI